jgi:NADPH:quinone reductase-like Zn-dependent oxidoreductase/malonyl CoA-acyl carrier protein transacylase/acyl carrier protein
MIERCDRLLRREGSWSLLEELGRDGSTSRLDETAIAQPAIFSLQVALASLWESWGIRPQAIVGHSVGEIAAAYLAGSLPLEEAARVIFHRGRCMDFAAARGKMLAVGLPPEEATALLKGREREVSLAAVNGPAAVTLSGEPEALHEIAEELLNRDTFHRFLKVNYAFHSPLMDPMREELLNALSDITPSAASLPMISTVTGLTVAGPELDADYWWQNVRQPVRFASAVQSLLEQAYDTFVELSPHPVLAGNILECAQERGSAGATVLPSLRRQEPERATMLKSLARLFTLGAPVDWKGANSEGRHVELPRYPWQRERYWSESEDSLLSRLAEHSHPLLGQRIAAANPTWKSSLDVRTLRFLDDHRVQGHVVLPATCYLEMAAFAAADFFGEGPAIVEELEIERACFLSDSSSITIETTLDPEESRFQVHARGLDSQRTWTKHASGRIRWAPDLAVPEAADLQSIRERCLQEVPGADCYAMLSTMGLEYGPSFRGIEKVWVGSGEVLGRVVAPAALDRGWEEYRLHPAITDSCVQLIAGLFQREAPGELGVYLPVAFEQVRLYRRAEKELWAHARIVDRQARTVIADLSILNASGRPIAEIKGLRCQAVDEVRGESLGDLVYEYEWVPAAQDSEGEDATRSIPAPSDIGSRTRKDAADFETDLGLHAVALAFERDIDPLCSAFVWKALLELGASLSPGSRFSTRELAEGCTIAPRHHRVLGSFLDMLAADGVLRKEDSTWEVIGSPVVSDPEAELRGLWERYPASYAELSLVKRTAVPLAEVLRGDLDPLELIFPGGSLATTDHLYQHSPTLRPYNMIAASAISVVADALPEGGRLRLLEVGAGTGGLSAYVLSRLPRETTRYVFTDVSNHFFVKAQEQFRDHTFVEYKLFDAEKDPTDQDFAPGGFDVVLAANVLHATRDLRQTVGNVRRLLAPGGLLLLVEGARPLRAMDLVFGLTEGFFRFEDRDLRPSHALMSFSGWKGLLESEGFEDVTLASEDAASRAQNNVILARRDRSPEAEVSIPAAGPRPGEEAASAAGRWLLLADGGWRAERLAEELRARGGDVEIALPGEENRRLDDRRHEIAAASPGDLRRLVAEIGSDGSPFRGVVHMWNLGAPRLEDSSVESLERVMTLGNLSVAYAARALAEIREGTPRLWVVTSGAEAVGADRHPVTVTAAPAWGLNRVVMNEFPMLRSVSVDLSPSPSEEEIVALASELLREGEEDEVALRGRHRYVHRFTRVADRAGHESGRLVRGGSQPFRLETLRPGLIDRLALRACHRGEPGPGQVEIAVSAAGLNFSDVMKALGLYPGLPEGPIPLGIECAGRIERVGEGVADFQPGDPVVAVTPFSFGTHALARAELVARKPEHLSFEQAATLPIAFLTAHYALNYVGRIAEGERVLVHSAAGGVGLAAIQLARRAGAEILATAGTVEKRDFLRSLGVQKVMDSRSLDFADEVLEATGGSGVDVVLNSLSGDAIYKGLSILREYGRFLEIGKRDIYQNHRLGMRPFRKNLSFTAIDLDRGIRDRPELFSRLLREVMGTFGPGQLRPLHHRVFPIAHAINAFRHMAQAKHIGKVVLSLSDRRASVVPAAPKEVRFSADGTYLISGGLGGFGIATARWIAERGGRHLVLMGRRGASTEEARTAVAELRQRGVEVKVATADVSVESEVASTLLEIEADMPPLCGVFHLALAVRDALLMNLNEEQMREVWAPKVLGSFHLHRLTLGKPLEVFALYSSMSAVFGTGGQGNYASANSFLDALAVHRKAKGLPGLSVSWGFLGETGFVARHPEVAQRFEAMGIRSFSPSQGLTLLGRFLGEERAQGGVMRVDWRRFEDLAAGRTISPRFAHLVRLAAAGKEDGSRRGGSAFRSALLAASPSERRSMLEAGLREQIGRVLGVAADKLDLETPLSDLGLDSLMAIELRNWVEGDLKVSLPAVELLKGPTLTQLADRLVEQLPDHLAADAAPKSSVPEIPTEAEDLNLGRDASELLSKVDDMSDEQVDALLERMEEGASGTR